MYARRFADGPRFRPASLGAALAINGGVIAALLLAAPEIIPIAPDDPIDIVFVPKPIPSPPPPKPQPTNRVKHLQPVPSATPNPGPDLDRLKDPVVTGDGPIIAPGNGETGDGPFVEPRPLPPPALVGASFDPRYSADIEPPYPDAARDAGTEGVVKLRVVIGADGRVKRAEPLAGDPVFIGVAVRHVLARWRFKPATRGGVPEESVRVMSVRFRLDS